MGNLWWGYLHTQGSIQAKRYFDKRDLEEADESPFVIKRYGPFESNDRSEALSILRNHFICESAPYPSCNGANGCDTCEHQPEV